jgi:Putative auto-transporter adhesin, head GIN domain
MKISITLILLTVLTALDATAETRQLNFTDFNEVSVGSGIRMSINQGATYRVEAIGAAADLDRLRVTYLGSRLTFWIESSFLGLFQAGRINLNITLPALRKVQLSGGSDGVLGVQCGSAPFAAALSGGSRLSGQVACGAIQMALSGGSRVDLAGSGQSLLLDGSGGSRYELKDLQVKDVKSNLSGGSRATLNLEGGLDANLSGGSQITYFGNGALGIVRTSGGATVRRGL